MAAPAVAGRARPRSSSPRGRSSTGRVVESPQRRFDGAVVPFRNHDGQPLGPVTATPTVEPRADGPVPGTHAIRGRHGGTRESLLRADRTDPRTPGIRTGRAGCAVGRRSVPSVHRRTSPVLQTPRTRIEDRLGGAEPRGSMFGHAGSNGRCSMLSALVLDDPKQRGSRARRIGPRPRGELRSLDGSRRRSVDDAVGRSAAAATEVAFGRWRGGRVPPAFRFPPRRSPARRRGPDRCG